MQIIFKTTLRKVLVILLFLYSLFGFIILPYLIQSNFTKVIKENLNTNGQISRVYINPFTFKIELHKLLIQDDQNKTLFYFKFLETNFELLSLVLNEIKLDYLNIDSLKTSFIIYEDNRFNVTHILNHLNQVKKETKSDSSKQNDSGLVFSINDLFLKDTHLIFEDMTKSKPFHIETEPFTFEMKNFSTKNNVTATFKSKINFVDTLNLNITSKLKLNPMQLNGDISLSKLQLGKIYAYLEDSLDFQFKGTIENISSSFNIESNDKTTKALINDLNIAVSNATYFNEQYNVSVNKVNHSIKNIAITQNELLNFEINKANLTTQSVNFMDLKINQNDILEFKNIDIELDKVSSDKSKNSHISLSFEAPKSGNINLVLNATQEPLNIEGTVNLEQLNIVPYKNYIKNFINLDIKKTLVDMNSKIDITKKEQNVQATVKISDIDLFHNLTQERLLQVDTFDIEGIRYTNDNLFIENVKLDTFQTFIKIDKNTNTNLDELIVKKEEDKKTPASKEDNKEIKSNFQYYIKKIAISNGKTDFSDHSLPLNFDTKIHSLTANINDFSSENKEADISLQGTIDKYGLTNINAKSIVSDFRDKTNVTVSFENLDVKSFSPYSGKFIGQKIADGRLWLDLNYNISKSQLLSTNNIKIKNLTLGENVESKDAMSLPVGLAIALLENNEGLIDLDVPVKGDMSNPTFELSGVIWKALGNIITNIVTSPFKFLGSLLGMDSDELGSIEFNFAQSEIKPPQKEKLDKLIEVLQKKQKLSILIQPSIHSTQDLTKLQEAKFTQLIKSENKKETIKKIYIEKFGEDKLNKLFAENKEEEEHINLLSQEIIKSITITKEELSQLAKTRANNLKNYFVAHKLTLDRIQIKEDVFENKDKNAQNISLKLELNIKE